MPKFKVTVTKEYSVVISANNEAEALGKADSIPMDRWRQEASPIYEIEEVSSKRQHELSTTA